MLDFNPIVKEKHSLTVPSGELSRLACEVIRGRTQVNPDGIPQELKARRQWVCWRWKRKEDGSWTKPPLDPKTGRAASATNSATWGTFEEAHGRYLQRENISGIGFVFCEADPYTGADVDHCILSDGSYLPLAQEVLDKLPSYTEISPSGDGFKVWARGKLPGAGFNNRRVGNGFEMYDQGRYFTVTGNVLDGQTEIKGCNLTVVELHRKYRTGDGTAPPEATPPDAEKTEKHSRARDTRENPPLCLSDEDLLEKAKRDPKFSRLWNGEWNGEWNGDYKSRSEADLGLFCKLAFWTGKDRERMLRLFERSGLYRETKKRSYFEHTIGKAIEGTTETYDPNYSRNNRQDDGAGAAAGKPQWEQPTDITRAIPPAPVFPIECLPYAAANYATDEAERMQCAVDLIAIPMLVAFAGLIGKDATIQPKRKDNWRERPCLWGTVIASKSEMKSPAQDKATAPLKRIQKKLFVEDATMLEEWEKKAEAAKLREGAWKKECKKILAKDSGAELPAKPKEVEELPPKPVARRTLTNDATIERMADLMVESRGLTLVRDELSGFLLNMSRYNAGSDRQFYLESYSGGSYTVDRVGRGNSFIEDLYLNIIGGIQPQVARKLFSIETGPDDGLFERFGLIAYPEKPTTYQHVDRWPDKMKREFFNQMCDKLADANWGELLDKDDFNPKGFAHFNEAAQDIFNEWLTEHRQMLRRIPDDDPIGGMMGKARGLLARLTLVIHLAAWAAGETPDPTTIVEESLSRALALLEEYLIPTWRRVFAAFGKTAADDGAHRIAKWIKAEKIQKVRFRDIRRKCWTGLSDDREIEPAIKMLVAHRWLGDPELTKNGRPTTDYPVNPLVHAEA
jgi:putative DNA primase/helicase